MLHHTRLHNFDVTFRNTEEFRELKREVFSQDTYHVDFESRDDIPRTAEGFVAPRIVDIGAHIGLTTLYWKYAFPAARILSVEPHPLAFSMLERNISQNRLEDVEALQAAIHSGNDPVRLITDADEVEETQWLSNTSVHRHTWQGDQPTFTRGITVPGITLDTLLEEEKQIDLMKIDIEGYEQAILNAASDDTLKKVQQLIIEFHPHSTQDLETLVGSLQRRGYSVKIYHRGKSIDIQDAPQTLLMLRAWR